MKYLQDPCTDHEEMLQHLRRLPQDYGRWIAQKEEESQKMEARYREVARKHMALCHVAQQRIMQGVQVLSRNKDAMEAFQLANRAILMQQHHSRLPHRELNDPFPELPSSYEEDYPDQRWRTFQLAFLLMCLPGVVDAED